MGELPRTLCLDCEQPIQDGVASDEYPADAEWSRCYLCALCRTHRYRTEAQAMARCEAGLARRNLLAAQAEGATSTESPSNAPF